MKQKDLVRHKNEKLSELEEEEREKQVNFITGISCIVDKNCYFKCKY